MGKQFISNFGRVEKQKYASSHECYFYYGYIMGNKKAFTLTELIAVIVILSILITLSVVVFMNIRRNTLEKRKLIQKFINYQKQKKMILI